MDFTKVLSSVPDERHIRVRLLGTGTTPTVELGQRVTVTRTAAGVYKITFDEGQGTFVGMNAPMFGAATPADVKGHTCTRDTYTAPTATAAGFIEVSVWNSSFAADDLQATEYLDLVFVFSQNSEVA